MFLVRRGALALAFCVAIPGFAQTWSGDFGAGLSLTRGNSDTKNLNLALQLTQKISTKDLAKYDAFYLRGDKDGALTVDRTTFGARDEYTISPLTYAFGDLDKGSGGRRFIWCSVHSDGDTQAHFFLPGLNRNLNLARFR